MCTWLRTLDYVYDVGERADGPALRLAFGCFSASNFMTWSGSRCLRLFLPIPGQQIDPENPP